MKLTIKGRIPSKKNQRDIFVRGGRIVNIPSEKYREWHREASKQIRNAKSGDYHNAHITMFAPDKRKADLTNKAESIMDLLVDNKVIKDDNWFEIENIVLLFGGVDRENPRAEIELT